MQKENKMNLSEQINKEVEAGEVGEYNATAAALSELKETYGTEIPQCETKDGYNRSKQIASECRAIRTALENKRKEIKAPALAFGKMIDSEAKRLKEEIENIEKPHLEAYRLVDELKKQKKAAFEQKLVDIKNIPTECFGLSSSQINEKIEELACISIDKETFGHKLEEAEGWIPSVLTQLTELHGKAIEAEVEAERIEAERVELEKLRKEAAEREAQEKAQREEVERKEREKQIAEQATRDAELRVQQEKKRAAEAAEQAEREKQELIAKSKREAEEAVERVEREKQQAVEAEKERQRLEKEQEEAAARAREENKRHRAKINNQALKCFVAGGLTEEQAKQVVTLIASKQIDNVAIYY